MKHKNSNSSATPSADGSNAPYDKLEGGPEESSKKQKWKPG